MRYVVFLFLCINYNSAVAQCKTRISPDYNFTMCKGNSIQINTNSSMTQYQWWPNKGISDTTVSSPVVSPDTTITYHIKAVDPTGCVDYDSITVYVIDCSLPGQFITVANNDFGSGKINPSIIRHDSIIPVKFVPLIGDPPSSFTTDGYSVVNQIPQSLNNDWHTGALNHTPNQGDSGYMAVYHNAPKDGLLYSSIFPHISSSIRQIQFSYAYPFKNPVNTPCNGSSLPSFPQLMIKINLGNGYDTNGQPIFPDSVYVDYGWPIGKVLMPYYTILYPDSPELDPNNLLWKTFTATTDHTQPNFFYGGDETGYRLKIFNLTPPSPCGNDFVLDDIHYNAYINYTSIYFRLPYDTVKLCTKTSQTYAASDLVNTSNVQFAWFKSLDKGKTWQAINNTNTDRTTLTYASQQKEEWIRLEGSTVVSFLPVQRFQSNYFIILSDAVFNAKAGNDTALCKGASLQLNATGGTYNLWSPPDYLSNTNTLNPVVTPATSMQYILQTSNDPNFAVSCTTYDTINIQVDEKPIVVAGNNQTINQGDSTKMNGVVVGNNVLLHWEPRQFFSDNTKLNAVCKPDTTRTFYLYADSKYGCGTGLDSMKIFVTPTAVVVPPTTNPSTNNSQIIPNAFSPNGDGINDTWEIPLLKNYPNCSVEVYNRYGQLVFKSIGYNKNWDGTLNNQALPIGTYYYIIKTSPSANLLSGSVLIIR